MKILVVGATGATGRLLVQQLLDRDYKVKVIVRNKQKMLGFVKAQPALSIVEANVLELSNEELANHVKDCHAVASCLGHNLTFKGMFGNPRRLVATALQRICQAIHVNNPKKPVKVILMNTTGVKHSTKDLPRSFAERCVIWLLRHLLPPHVDNEKAVEYLREQVGNHNQTIEWSVVRPDSLLNHENVSEYTVHPGTTRSAIFNAGVTSRCNVAHWMAELIANEDAWEQWKFQMPVVYNQVHT